MKIKQPRRWKKQTSSEQQTAAWRWIGGILWSMLFLAGVAVGIGFVSEKEIRTDLASASRISGASDWQEVFDQQLSRSAPGRSELVRAVTKCVTAAGGTKVGNVYLTSDRLLECPETLDSEALSETASLLNDFYSNWQIPTAVIAVPSAGELYADDLLEGLSFPSQLSAIDAFYGEIRSPICKIDVYHVLFTTTSDYIYNRTDPRWTGYGAYCVYRTAIQKMGFSPVSYDQYSVTHTESFRGSLYEACLYESVTPDILETYQCKSGSTVTKFTAYPADGDPEQRKLYETAQNADPDTYYLGEPCEKMVIETNVDNDKKLLLLKDSYGDSMVPFLTQHYSEICVLDLRYLEHSAEELADIASYSQVLLLCDADDYQNQELMQMALGHL